MSNLKCCNRILNRRNTIGVGNPSFLFTYYSLRKREENRWYSRLTLRQRKRLHRLILLIYCIKNRLGGFSHEVIRDLHSETNKPIIFAVTHVGKFDIEVVSEAIRSHYYLLSGDYEHIQGIIDAPFLGLNGVIYFNENVKEERRSATERMNRMLQGGNLMYFPEGAWNLSPNEMIYDKIGSGNTEEKITIY